MPLPPVDSMPVAVRAFAVKSAREHTLKPIGMPLKKTPEPSYWTLTFDTETTTDETQNLRFGTYQVRKYDKLHESGVFYDHDILRKIEIDRLKHYAKTHDLKIMPVRQFVDEIFYGIGYTYRASIVGFNLPFDISRLAIGHSSARTTKRNKIMKGGFTFKLSENDFHPNVQIKHISSRDAFIQFTSTIGQRTSRGKRKQKRYQPIRRGFFIDVKTLAAALLSRSFSLDSLARHLKVDALKHNTDEHGRELTDEYIAYAVQDTQTTWESYERLMAMYAHHGLNQTPAYKIHSEASLGKAYLKEMGIKPWRERQPDFPSNQLGQIMSAYFGGRSEVHIRKQAVQMQYCDFLSMYPTVCTLMGLWRFVTAESMTWNDSTEVTQQYLDEITLNMLQKQDTWKQLPILVQVLPDQDIFPIRAKYSEDTQYTIGLNDLTSESPLWYTLADCIASKLLTGKSPKILKAITYQPKGLQDVLNPVYVAGNEAFQVDPASGDFFKRVIDLRRQVKCEMQSCDSTEMQRLNTQQQSLKILANSTSYGIFVELNVEQEKVKQPLTCYGHDGEPQAIKMNKFEEPGKYFHPLLATLITGAARLMLAITERLTIDQGLDWAFCDTDSMALARPEEMDLETFYAKASTVQAWFESLNPYEQPGSLFKTEDENYSLSGNGELEPLYCFAISSKRYALYNLDQDGKPILRKVSGHGLGHLLPPYVGSMSSPSSEAKNWQDDMWLEIINATLEGRHPKYSLLHGFDQPSVSRYGATSPELLRWFKAHNEDRPYKQQVKPFNFLLALQARHDCKKLKPAAPFDKDMSMAASRCFDRETSEPIESDKLKTYQESLAQYHLHPETKFLNGDYLDSGKTERRHVVVQSIQYIGKEANKWEEQFYTGLNSEVHVVYGTNTESLDVVLQSVKKNGIKRFAEIAKVSVRHVHNIYHNKTAPSEKMLTKLLRAAFLVGQHM
jgi:hypothetical protein